MKATGIVRRIEMCIRDRCWMLVLAMAAATGFSGNPETGEDDGTGETALEAEGGSGEEDTRYLTLSAVASSSGLFPYCVAIGEVLSELPELEVTVAESGRNVANAQELRAGEISIANSISNTDYESYTGTGATFEGDPFQDFRILWYYAVSYTHLHQTVHGSHGPAVVV